MSSRSFVPSTPADPAANRPSPAGTSAASGADARFLSAVMRLDAVVCGVAGVASLAGAALLDGPLGLPAGFLAGIGGFLAVWAVAVGAVAARGASAARRPGAGAVGAVIALNLVWAALSVVMAVAGWLDPTTLGTVVVLVQAVAVLGIADLQLLGVRKARRPGPGT